MAKANETRQDIVNKLEMSDEEFKTTRTSKKMQEEMVKSQIRLTHEKHEHQREQTRKRNTKNKGTRTGNSRNKTTGTVQ